MKTHTGTIQVSVNISEQERQLLPDFSSQTWLEVSQADILMERSFLLVVCERNCWIHHRLHSGQMKAGRKWILKVIEHRLQGRWCKAEVWRGVRHFADWHVVLRHVEVILCALPFDLFSNIEVLVIYVFTLLKTLLRSLANSTSAAAWAALLLSPALQSGLKETQRHPALPAEWLSSYRELKIHQVFLDPEGFGWP